MTSQNSCIKLAVSIKFACPPGRSLSGTCRAQNTKLYTSALIAEMVCGGSANKLLYSFAQSFRASGTPVYEYMNERIAARTVFGSVGVELSDSSDSE